MVNGDADGWSELAWDTSLLWNGLDMIFLLAGCSKHVGKSWTDLQLLEGETTASSDAAVVLNGGTSYNWAELVDWARSKGGSLRETSLTTSVFPAGLNREVC